MRRGEQGELLKGNTPTLILAVLGDGPLHGYAIAREIERRSDSALSLGEGSLYPALRGLETDGLIQGAWEPQPSGPARKVYSLTDRGRAVLVERTEIWREFARAVEAILGGPRNVPEPS